MNKIWALNRVYIYELHIRIYRCTQCTWFIFSSWKVLGLAAEVPVVAMVLWQFIFVLHTAVLLLTEVPQAAKKLLLLFVVVILVKHCHRNSTSVDLLLHHKWVIWTTTCGCSSPTFGYHSARCCCCCSIFMVTVKSLILSPNPPRSATNNSNVQILEQHMPCRKS